MPSSGDSDSESDILKNRNTTPELERGLTQHKDRSVYSRVAADEDDELGHNDNEKAYTNASTSQLLAATENDTSAQDDEGQRLLAGQDGDKDEADVASGARSSIRNQQGKGRFKLGAAVDASKHRRRQSKGQLDGDEAERRFLGLQPRTALLLMIPLLVLLVGLYKYTPISHWGSEEDEVQYDSKGRPLAHVGADWADILGEEHEEHKVPGLMSNGTHAWNRTVIIVSLDGLRWDYLDRGKTPNLLAASRQGLRAEHMRPIFPSLTFPNHWALQTGLYAESHGIVANDFWDSAENEHFSYQEDATNWEPKWWLGEPMWATVVKNGGRSAVSMWPGPSRLLDGTKPSFYVPWQPAMTWEQKADQVERWLDKSDATRPHLICMYLWDVDSHGHNGGPDSAEVDEALQTVDSFVGAVYKALDDRNLNDIVDVVFVSDHGMTSCSDERVIMLEDVLGHDGYDAIEHKEGWPSCGLRFKAGTDEAEMVRRIQEGAAKHKNGYAYYTHETMPTEYHFSRHERIAPHYLVPDLGWAISDQQEGMLDENGKYRIMGNHGYNNSYPDMFAMMTLTGPSAKRMKHAIRSRGTHDERALQVIPGFDNVNIYNLVTSKLLQLEKLAPNNGTDGFWDQYFVD